MAGSDYVLGVWMGAFPAELRPFAHFVTDLGEGVEVLVTSGLLLLLSALLPMASMRRRMQVGLNAITVAAAFIFLSVAGGGLVTLVLKYAIGPARPILQDSHGYLSFQPFAMNPDFSAFPSGHSATAAAMAIRWRWYFLA
jgi:undecaprenyl-diphosphatase